MKVSLEKRRRVSRYDISRLDSLSTFTNIYTRNIWMIFLSPSIDGSMDRWVEYGKIVSIVVGKRNGRAGRPPPPRSSRARGNYDFESNKYLQSLCAGHVTGGERERDIEGRREEQSCNERSTAAKLAIAYYIIHEWRSFRRARIGPGDSFFCHRRRDCEKQKQRGAPYSQPGELFQQTYDVRCVVATSVVVVTHSPERISLMSFVKGLLMRADVLAPFKNVSWFIRAAGKIR